MQAQAPKRGPGRPRTGQPRKPRIDITISHDVQMFLLECGQEMNVSEFINTLIKDSKLYQAWKSHITPSLPTH